MSVVASLPRLESFGGALPRLDSLGSAGKEDIDDLSIEHLLEGYPDLHQEWDMGSTTMFAEPVQVHAVPPKAFAPWVPADDQPTKTVVTSKKRKQPIQTVAATQQEQVMQMPGAWFDMPEFAPMAGTMQNAMTDDMMFDAINEAVANQSLATCQNGNAHMPVNDDPPPAYSPPANETGAPDLDTNILGFFKTGEFRDVLLSDRSEQATPKATVENVSSAPAVCDESSTPQQKITRGPYQYIFGVDPDPKVAAKKRAVRQAAFSRYRQKKIDRANRPVIRYKSRKKIADNRPRVKGRFIKTGNAVRAEAKHAVTKA
jgi:hypothetical protein